MAAILVSFYRTTGLTLWVKVVKRTDKNILDINDDTFKLTPTWVNSLTAVAETTTVSKGYYWANITFPAGIHLCDILILNSNVADSEPIDGYEFIADGTTGQQITAHAFVGTDGKVLLSANAQALSATLEVDAKLVNSLTPLSSADIVTNVWAQAMTDLAQGAPSATASVLTAINYLYEALRNKTETTEGELAIMRDDGATKLIKSVLSDDGTTFTKNEFISGA